MLKFLKRLFGRKVAHVPADIRPMSEALQLEEASSSKAFQEAIDAIDAVHKDGKLPEIRVTRALFTNRHGQFSVRITGELLIQISYFTQHAELTTVHEIGHFLDYSGLDRPGELASLTSPALAQWRRAIQESEAVQRMKPLLQSGANRIAETSPDGIVVEYTVDQVYLRYLLTPQELWARSYAQFIATRSGSPALWLQLNHLRDRPARAFYYGEQWEDMDFLPIMTEIETLFHRLGWL